MIQVTPEQLSRCLSGDLGSMAEDEALLQPLTALLTSFRRGDDYAVLNAEAEHILFEYVNGQLGVHMTYVQPDGTPHRVLLKDVERLADTVTGLQLAALPAGENTFLTLHEYVLRSGSPAAVRLLLDGYTDRLTPDEIRIFRPILQANEPKGND